MEVQAKTPYGFVPLRQLSLGYQTTTAWILISRREMFVRYPDSKRPLEENAVVLVDEIDLHLHPRWQRKLFRQLETHFPNVQFVVTAHGPLVGHKQRVPMPICRNPPARKRRDTSSSTTNARRYRTGALTKF